MQKYLLITIVVLLAAVLIFQLTGSKEVEAEGKPAKCICSEEIHESAGTIQHCRCGERDCVVINSGGISCK
jgi:hypothetical protein